MFVYVGVMLVVSSVRPPVAPLNSVRLHEAVLRDRRGRRDRLGFVASWDAMAEYGNGDGCRRSPLGAASDVGCLGAGEARGDPSGDGESRIDMVAMCRLW